jgi:monofunctional biosynthetic peptidoglycan transglycosylase
VWVWIRRVVVAAIVLGDLLICLPILQVLDVRFRDPWVTWTQVDQAVALRGFPRRSWRDLDEMGHVPLAVVSAEDQRFFSHHGFDWEAIQKAIEANQEKSDRKVGASTITQQTARNLFLWQGRTWLRKGLEAGYTVLLEALVPKHRILELYLNIAETGPLTFGMQAGANHWFRKDVDRLTRREAALLAALLPAPRSWKPTDRRVQRRATWIGAHPAPMEPKPGLGPERQKD